MAVSALTNSQNTLARNQSNISDHPFSGMTEREQNYDRIQVGGTEISTYDI
jgi:hypothetical protein